MVTIVKTVGRCEGIHVLQRHLVIDKERKNSVYIQDQHLLQAIGGSIAAMIGSSIMCQSIPYKKGFGAKQMAWLVHAGVLGAVVAPVTLLGGPILVRAAWYTAGLIGGKNIT